MTCDFCAIAADSSLADVVAEWPDAIAFLPRRKHGRRGCATGHTLVVPRAHVIDAAADPLIAASAMARAAELAARLRQQGDLRAFNIIINAGEEATQTVNHLHIHLVPRRKDDGLALPWSGRRIA